MCPLETRWDGSSQGEYVQFAAAQKVWSQLRAGIIKVVLCRNVHATNVVAERIHDG